MSRFASAVGGPDDLPEYKGHFSPEDLHKMCAGESPPTARRPAATGAAMAGDSRRRAASSPPAPQRQRMRR